MMKVPMIFVLFGLLIVFLVVWAGLSPAFDDLQMSGTLWSANATLGVSANDTIAASPTSEAISQSFKYILLALGAGGILYGMFNLMKSGGGGE